MNVRQLIERLKELIAEDSTVADLDVYTWLESRESFDASQAPGDWEGDEVPTGAVVDIVVPSEIDENGNDLGSYVVIRSVLDE